MKSKALNPDTAPYLMAPGGYADWLADLKIHIHGARQRAMRTVSGELMFLYWQIGRANLTYMHAFADAWPAAEIVQRAVGQLHWGHNRVLATKDEVE